MTAKLQPQPVVAPRFPVPPPGVLHESVEFDPHPLAFEPALPSSDNENYNEIGLGLGLGPNFFDFYGDGGLFDVISRRIDALPSDAGAPGGTTSFTDDLRTHGSPQAGCISPSVGPSDALFLTKPKPEDGLEKRAGGFDPEIFLGNSIFGDDTDESDLYQASDYADRYIKFKPFSPYSSDSEIGDVRTPRDGSGPSPPIISGPWDKDPEGSDLDSSEEADDEQKNSSRLERALDNKTHRIKPDGLFPLEVAHLQDSSSSSVVSSVEGLPLVPFTGLTTAPLLLTDDSDTSAKLIWTQDPQLQFAFSDDENLDMDGLFALGVVVGSPGSHYNALASESESGFTPPPLPLSGDESFSSGDDLFPFPLEYHAEFNVVEAGHLFPWAIEESENDDPQLRLVIARSELEQELKRREKGLLKTDESKALLKMLRDTPIAPVATLLVKLLAPSDWTSCLDCGYFIDTKCCVDALIDGEQENELESATESIGELPDFYDAFLLGADELFM